jgi:hypothetical protein
VIGVVDGAGADDVVGGAPVASVLPADAVVAGAAEVAVMAVVADDAFSSLASLPAQLLATRRQPVGAR